MLRKEKGITLVALVVTIIILLILAGVSITMVSGNGLFGRASNAASSYGTASQAENQAVSWYEQQLANYESNITNP